MTTRFVRYVKNQVSDVDPAVARALVEAPWPRYFATAATEIDHYLAAPGCKQLRAIAVRWDHEAGAGVVLDADRGKRAFADGPVDPRRVVDWSAFVRDELGLAPAALADHAAYAAIATCLTYACAEVVVQRAGQLRGAAKQGWALAVVPGHDETPRVVYRSSEPRDSVFDDAGQFAIATVEESIERTAAEPHALAALLAGLPNAGDGMSLLLKLDLAFYHIASGGTVAAHRDDVRALVAAIKDHGARLGLAARAWSELYEKMLAKALCCVEGDRAGFELVRGMVPSSVAVPELAYNLACMHAQAGERDEALRWTAATLDLGYPADKFAASDFASLRDDAELQRLLSTPNTAALTARLGAAVDKLDVARVIELLAAGADPDGEYDGSGSGLGREPILIAALGARARKAPDRVKRLEIVTALLDRGATLEDHQWPMRRLVDDHALLALALARGAPVTQTLVTAAIEGAAIDAVRMLVERGTDLGDAAVALAACRHHKTTDTLAFLLGHGLDVNATDPNGRTAVLSCAFGCELPILEALLAAGGKLDARAADGSTFVANALFNDRVELVELAIARGADLTVVDKSGAGLVYLAIAAGAAKSFAVLLGHGAPIGAANANGATALHAAAERNNLEAVRQLVDRGADRGAKDSDGKRPLDLAKGVAIRKLLAP